LAIWVPLAPKAVGAEADASPSGGDEDKQRFRLVWMFDIQDTKEIGAADDEQNGNGEAEEVDHDHQ